MRRGATFFSFFCTLLGVLLRPAEITENLMFNLLSAFLRISLTSDRLYSEKRVADIAVFVAGKNRAIRQVEQTKCNFFIATLK